ncbi:hypothetical protein CEXT_637591 [Caerostris extrusa]|uniref:Uncharacterized protein n=1 Tax=Caerostris extrusa TaxID=172846 RepID=A0AAV4RHT3_CAEEX|nr:hypothetical protein CEXT_637591 [Caerostris extrusa]
MTSTVYKLGERNVYAKGCVFDVVLSFLYACKFPEKSSISFSPFTWWLTRLLNLISPEDPRPTKLIRYQLISPCSSCVFLSARSRRKTPSNLFSVASCYIIRQTRARAIDYIALIHHLGW